MEISIDEIEKKFESLPEDLRWAIMGANIDDKVIEIGQAHKLDVAQMGQLSLEVHAVVLGFVHPDKFEESLKGSLQLSDEINKNIVTDINNKILKNIREKLMTLSETKIEEEQMPIKIEAQTEIKKDESIGNSENAILKGAGIEVMPQEIGVGKSSLPENKLTEPQKMPKVTTAYTANTSEVEKKEAGSAQSKVEAPKTNPSAKGDPYRMPIE